MKTTSDVIAWVGANVPKNPTQTPRDQALWWAAYRSAESIHSGFTVKDLALMLLDGTPPIETDEDIQSVINGFFYDEDAPDDDEIKQVEADLRDFWGLK